LTLYLHNRAGDDKNIRDTISDIAEEAREQTGAAFSTETVRTYCRKLGIRFIENKRKAHGREISSLEAQVLQSQIWALAKVVNRLTLELGVTNERIIEPLVPLCREQPPAADENGTR